MSWHLEADLWQWEVEKKSTTKTRGTSPYYDTIKELILGHNGFVIGIAQSTTYFHRATQIESKVIKIETTNKAKKNKIRTL